MSDLVERVANCHIGSCQRHQNCMYHPCRSFAAMQTDAAPALKPAVEVWQEASDAATYGSVKYQPHADQVAAAVIEADRAAIIAAKDAEIAALKEKLAEQAEDNADLPTIAYFAGAADARDRLAALQAHTDALAGALGEVMGWVAGWTPDFTQDEEWPDTREKVSLALRAYEESRRG